MVYIISRIRLGKTINDRQQSLRGSLMRYYAEANPLQISVDSADSSQNP